MILIPTTILAIFVVLLMALRSTLLGLLPASLATGLGSDVQRPLATVVISGCRARPR